MKHYSEAELLETYYMQPAEATPIMTHLASCSECVARYQRLSRKLREGAACSTERPTTFWSRQRLSIMRKIEQHRASGERTVRTFRVAAAAVLAFFLGGAVVYKSVEPALKQPTVVITQPTTSTPPPSEDELQIPRDPWQSEELSDFHGVVQWESWVDETRGAKG